MDSKLDMVDCGAIEVIGVNLNTGVMHDGHCSTSASTGAHSKYINSDIIFVNIWE